MLRGAEDEGERKNTDWLPHLGVWLATCRNAVAKKCGKYCSHRRSLLSFVSQLNLRSDLWGTVSSLWLTHSLQYRQADWSFVHPAFESDRLRSSFTGRPILGAHSTLCPRYRLGIRKLLAGEPARVRPDHASERRSQRVDRFRRLSVKCLKKTTTSNFTADSNRNVLVRVRLTRDTAVEEILLLPNQNWKQRLYFLLKSANENMAH